MKFRKKFRKRLIIIEAEQWFPGNEIPWADIKSQPIFIDDPYTSVLHWKGSDYYINTLEGSMTLKEGDWIIKGINGETYLCKPDIFEKTHERVEN